MSMYNEKKIRGYFGQELNVGDTIAFSAKSGGNTVRVCVIKSISFTEDRRGERKWDGDLYKVVPGIERVYYMPKVIVTVYNPHFRKWNWDEKTRTGSVDVYTKTYDKEIFNWQTAVTLRYAYGEQPDFSNIPALYEEVPA